MGVTKGHIKITALTIVAIGLTACAHRAETPVPIISAGTAIAVDPGIIFGGKIVTMNDAGDVWPNAKLWIREGRIEAIFKAGESLAATAAQARVVETGGAIYPGLIDLHNHPEYAIYPLMPITRKYRDRYEWRNYDTDYDKRVNLPNVLLNNAEYYNLGMDVGRYGEYMALAGGTTALQGGGSSYPLTTAAVLSGGRYFRPYAMAECLVRNIETAPVVPARAYSHVDIGRDLIEWQRLQEDSRRGTVIVHLAEGTSSRMADEFRYIKTAGLLDRNLVVIHGVGLTEPQFKEMAAVDAKLVWSPLSNFLLYGKTANVRAAKEAGVSISLAPDWGPSGSKSALGELKVADLVNREQLNSLFSDRDLVALVTRNPARALGWDQKLGQIRPGYLADLLVVDDRRVDAYRNLVLATEENIRLVVVRGEALYGDSQPLAVARAGRATGADIEEVAVLAHGARRKAIAPNCPGSGMPDSSVRTVKARLQEALQFGPAYTARVVSTEQIAKDLAHCNEAKPATPASAADALRMLACRFGLPFEKTDVAPLTTAEDALFLSRVVANPNVPAFLRALPTYYQQQDTTAPTAR